MTDEEIERWQSERIAAMRKHLASLPHDRLVKYASEVCAQIILACAEVDATDWPEGLHMADVVEKRLMRAVEKRLGKPEWRANPE